MGPLHVALSGGTRSFTTNWPFYPVGLPVGKFGGGLRRLWNEWKSELHEVQILLNTS